MSTSDISDGRWEFYDSWVAFPRNRVREDDRRIVGEFMISLSSPGGGTYGEFAIRFHDFHKNERWRPTEIAARLEAFGDSWRAIASRPDLINALALMDGMAQGPDEIRATLLGLGFDDVTEKLRGNGPAYCPTCLGKGVLDDVAEVDQ